MAHGQGSTVHQGRGSTAAGAANWLVTLHQYTGSRQWQEVVPSYTASRPIFCDPLPPSKTPPPKGSTDSPKVPQTGDPVFTHVSLWEVYSNHKKHCQVSDMGWVLAWKPLCWTYNSGTALNSFISTMPTGYNVYHLFPLPSTPPPPLPLLTSTPLLPSP